MSFIIFTLGVMFIFGWNHYDIDKITGCFLMLVSTITYAYIAYNINWIFP